MTISDLIARLTKLHKDGIVNSRAQVILNTGETHPYFEIVVVGSDVELRKTDIWDNHNRVKPEPMKLGGE